MGGKEKKENINSKERIISGNRAKNKRFEETGKLARACVPYGQEHTCVALRCTTCTRTADTQFHCRRYPLFARGSGEQLIGIFALVRSCGLHMARRFRNDTDVVFARARDKRKKRKKKRKKKKKELFEGGSTSFERASVTRKEDLRKESPVKFSAKSTTFVPISDKNARIVARRIDLTNLMITTRRSFHDPRTGKNSSHPLESSGWDGNVALVKTRYCLTQQVAAIPSPTSQHLHRRATPHATSTRRCIK